jgi:hypothetical protein
LNFFGTPKVTTFLVLFLVISTYVIWSSIFSLDFDLH